jgi:hypothetical protein
LLTTPVLVKEVYHNAAEESEHKVKCRHEYKTFVDPAFYAETVGEPWIYTYKVKKIANKDHHFITVPNGGECCLLWAAIMIKILRSPHYW